jgi:hypothetical protein
MKRRIVVVSLFLTFAATAFAHGNEEHLMGTVTAVVNNIITVKTTTGKLTEVSITEKTTFSRAGQMAELKDIKVGERVVIHAKKTGDRLEATTVQLGRSGQRAGAN